MRGWFVETSEECTNRLFVKPDHEAFSLAENRSAKQIRLLTDQCDQLCPWWQLFREPTRLEDGVARVEEWQDIVRSKDRLDLLRR